MSHRSKNQARSWKERAMSLVLAAVLLLGTVPGLTLPSSAHWADEYLDKMVDWGVMRGDIGGNMAPDRSITRAEFVAMMNRAYGYTRLAGHPFTDVRTSDYYYEAALWAHQKGMVSGSALRPFAPCTRASTMEFMWKAAGSPAVSGNRRFDDVSVNASYARAVAWATEQKITSGTSSTTFSPNNICTRGQIVTFLYRAMGW